MQIVLGLMLMLTLQDFQHPPPDFMDFGVVRFLINGMLKNRIPVLYYCKYHCNKPGYIV
jgi:hypothetical protein